MSLTFCNLHFTQQPDKVVYVSNALMKSLNLSGKNDTSAVWARPGTCNHQTDQEGRETPLSRLGHTQSDERSQAGQHLSAQPAK